MQHVFDLTTTTPARQSVCQAARLLAFYSIYLLEWPHSDLLARRSSIHKDDFVEASAEEKLH